MKNQFKKTLFFSFIVILAGANFNHILGQNKNIDQFELEDTTGIRIFIEKGDFTSLEKYNLWEKVRKRANKSNHKSTFFYFLKAINAVPSNFSNEEKVIKYTSFSIYATNQYLFDVALKYTYLAEAIAEDSDNNYLRGKVYHALGWYYAANSEYTRAIETYDKTIEYFKSVNFEKGIKSTLIKKGFALQLMDNHPEALLQFEAVYNSCKKPKISILSLLAKSYFENDKKLKAADVLSQYFQKIKDKKLDTTRSHRFLILRAIESNIKGRDQKEEFYLKQSLKIARKFNQNKEEFGSFIRLGRFYLAKNEFSKAKINFNKANDLVYRELMQNRYNIPNKYLLQIAHMEGNRADVNKYKALEQYYKKDSKQKINVNKTIENNKKAVLVRQKREIQSQNQKIWILALLGAIVLGLLFFSFFYFRRYMKIVKDLSDKNRLLDESVNEKQTLLQETHHRVKNNLQIIASLLNLQRKYTKDKKLTSALIDGRNRVKSMALIHQLLYQKKELKGINVRNYVENLMSSLFSSLKANAENIRFVNQVEPLNLHEDTLLAIGLIINEVVTNSLKYAFNEKREGEIRITLLKTKAHLYLSILDDGDGMPKDFEINDKSSFGYSLITSLSKKLDAKITIHKKNGTCVNLAISRFIET